jgi:hypothetical protein
MEPKDYYPVNNLHTVSSECISFVVFYSYEILWVILMVYQLLISIKRNVVKYVYIEESLPCSQHPTTDRR